MESYRLIGYENREIADDDFDDLDVDAGELGSGHHATALYEVRLADGVQPGLAIGTASLKWRSIGTGEPATTRVDLRAADPEATPSPTWELAVTAADTAQLLKGAPPFAERGVDVADLRDRAAALEADGVPGAGELADLLELAAD